MFPASARVAVLSPHLDDAVFSLGASIATAARRGTAVSVVTVFGCDPESSAAPGWWDRQAGFATEGEAARQRRQEDIRACSLVGATPIHLPFADATYPVERNSETIWASVLEAVKDADVVFIPGFPLDHPDHAWLTRLVLSRGLATAELALYVEQPYAMRREQHGLEAETPSELAALPAPRWEKLKLTRRAALEKARASLAYRSQTRMLGRFPVGAIPVLRILGYEARHGGEGVATVRPRPARGAGASAASLSA